MGFEVQKVTVTVTAQQSTTSVTFQNPVIQCIAGITWFDVAHPSKDYDVGEVRASVAVFNIDGKTVQLTASILLTNDDGNASDNGQITISVLAWTDASNANGSGTPFPSNWYYMAGANTAATAISNNTTIVVDGVPDTFSVYPELSDFDIGFGGSNCQINGLSASVGAVNNRDFSATISGYAYMNGSKGKEATTAEVKANLFGIDNAAISLATTVTPSNPNPQIDSCSTLAVQSLINCGNGSTVATFDKPLAGAAVFMEGFCLSYEKSGYHEVSTMAAGASGFTVSGNTVSISSQAVMKNTHSNSQDNTLSHVNLVVFGIFS